MDLLLILYAMIAGLTGFNAGPSTVVRAPEVTQGRVVAGGQRALAPQAAVAVKALVRRAAITVVRLAPLAVDARRVAVETTSIALPLVGRLVPERRLE